MEKKPAENGSNDSSSNEKPTAANVRGPKKGKGLKALIIKRIVSTIQGRQEGEWKLAVWKEGGYSSLSDKRKIFSVVCTK